MLFLLLLPFLEALLLFALDYYIIHTDAHALMKWFNVSTKRFFFFFLLIRADTTVEKQLLYKAPIPHGSALAHFFFLS